MAEICDDCMSSIGHEQWCSAPAHISLEKAKATIAKQAARIAELEAENASMRTSLADEVAAVSELEAELAFSESRIEGNKEYARQCGEKYQATIAGLRAERYGQHALCCNYHDRPVGQCNCVAVMKSEAGQMEERQNTINALRAEIASLA